MKRLAIIAFALLAACSGEKEEEPRTIPLEVETSPGLVTASGRWVSSAKLDTPFLARINSADISCRQETMSCTDALAVMMTSKDEPRLNGELLLSVLDSYTIDSWTDTNIHATSEKPVADLTLEIDLVRKLLKRTYRETKARGSSTADPTFIVAWDLQ
jgi:hypothetical protein